MTRTVVSFKFSPQTDAELWSNPNMTPAHAEADTLAAICPAQRKPVRAPGVIKRWTYIPVQRREDEELQSAQHNRIKAVEETWEASGLQVVKIV